MKTTKITAVILATIFVMCMFQVSVPTTAAPVTTQSYPGTGPTADYLIFKIYEDEIAEYLALKAGDIDIMDWPIATSQISDAIAERDAGHLNLSEQPEAGMREFTVNCRTFDYPSVTGYAGYPMNTTEFRQIIAYMVDKEDIVATALGGYGFVMESPIPGAFYGEWSYDGHVATYPYSLASANASLWAAGYQYVADPGPVQMSSYPFTGGKWIVPLDGSDLRSIDILARSDDPPRLYAGRQLRDSFVALDMPVTIRELNSLGCRAVALEAPNDDWDLWTSGWSLTADPDYLWDFFNSAAPLGTNTGGFSNSDYDYWSNRFMASATYDDALEAAYNCQRILCIQNPYICLYQTLAIFGARSNVKGLVDSTGYGYPNFWTMMEGHYAGQAYGGTLTQGLKQGIGVLNCITAEWFWDWQVLGMIYDGLFARDPYSLAWQPWLCEQYDITVFNWTSAHDSEQGMKVSFTLRDNITFHDGVKCTANDVAFSYNWEVNILQAPRMTLAWPMQNATAYDDLHGAIFINATSYFALAQLAKVIVVPQHIWGTYTSFDAVKATRPEQVGMLIGTGPYAFSEYVPGEYVKLTAFTDYFRVASDRPKIALGTVITVPKGTPAVLPVGMILHNVTKGNVAGNRIDNATLAGTLTGSAGLAAGLGGTYNPASHEYSVAFDTSFLDLGTYTAFVSAGYNVTSGASSKTYLYTVHIVAPTEWYATGIGLFAIGATVAAVLVTAVLGYSLLKAKKAVK